MDYLICRPPNANAKVWHDLQTRLETRISKPERKEILPEFKSLANYLEYEIFVLLEYDLILKV